MINKNLISIEAIFFKYNCNSTFFQKHIGFIITTTTETGNLYHLKTFRERKPEKYQKQLKQIKTYLNELCIDFIPNIENLSIISFTHSNVSNLAVNVFYLSDYTTNYSLFTDSLSENKTIFSNLHFW